MAGPLRPVELAAAAVLAGVAVTLVTVGALLPHAGGIQQLAAVPLAIVAHRHRARALVAAAVIGGTVSFLTGGIGGALAIVAAAVVGGCVGTVSRRGRGAGTVLALALVVGPLCAVAADLALLVFAASRELAFESARASAAGLTHALRVVPAAGALADLIDNLVSVVLARWWLWVFLAVAAGVVVGMLVTWWVVAAILRRLSWISFDDLLDPGAPATGGAAAHEDGLASPPGPLPVTLWEVRFRYPGAATDALRGVSLSLDRAELVAVAGPNGSGKSTLVRVLAGAAPSGGTVQRPGGVGLGRSGGTALIMQRPETQVLGMTVADDVTWGLPPDHGVDVGALLDAVGLGAMADRTTASLSGGELQRLAVAAALAHRPALLVSDESTAMVDAGGREALLALLAQLPGRFGTTVVHVTHAPEEAAHADRVIHMAEGRIDSDARRPAGAGCPGPAGDVPGSRPVKATAPGTARATAARATQRRPGQTDPPILEARHVAHTYGYGTPWAHRALRDVSLDLFRGDGLLITGGNGSGKSTLAWVLAGLVRPTGGRCTLDGRPVAGQVGAVALAFQHARLQLQRPTVAADVLAASGRPVARGAPSGDSHDFVIRSLATVGLPADLARRNIDALSGGQMRRVALAGLLAGRPRVLILDEPLAGLDPHSRAELLGTLARLRSHDGLSLIVISHDVAGMESVCPRTAVLSEGVLR